MAVDDISFNTFVLKEIFHNNFQLKTCTSGNEAILEIKNAYFNRIKCN